MLRYSALMKVGDSDRAIRPRTIYGRLGCRSTLTVCWNPLAGGSGAAGVHGMGIDRMLCRLIDRVAAS